MDIGSIQNPLTQGPISSIARPPSAGAVREASVSSSSAAAGEQKITQDGVSQTENISRDQVEEAVAAIQKFVQSARRDIDFSVDDTSGHVVVRVTDSSSGDVIRQIPSEEALHLAESLADVRSLLFKAEA